MLANDPLETITDAGGELVLFVRCTICGTNVWDRSKDGPVTHDALVKAGGLHLGVAHADRYEITPAGSEFLKSGRFPSSGKP